MTDIFGEEFAERHRFSNRSEFSICSCDFVNMRRILKGEKFDINSQFASFIQYCSETRSAQESQSQNSQSQNSHSQNSHSQQDWSQNLSQNDFEDLSEALSFEDEAPSELERCDSESDPDEFLPNIFQDSEEDSGFSAELRNSETTESSQEDQVKIKWRGKTKNLLRLNLADHFSEKCILCHCEVPDREYLTLDFVHQLCDQKKSPLALKNWSPRHFLCALCHKDGKVTNIGADILKNSEKVKKIRKNKFTLGVFPQVTQEDFI